MAEKTESQIQAEILAAIGSFKGIQVMRVNTGVFHDDQGVRRIRSVDKGTYDILCCVQIHMKRMETVDSGSMQFQLPRYYTFGQLVWLEVKMPGKNLNDDQVKFGNVWKRAGAICRRVTSADEALAVLQHIMGYIPCSNGVPDGIIFE